MSGRVLFLIALLATTGYGQIPKDRLISFFNHQSTRVYYWGVALDKPPESYQKDRQFVPVKVQTQGSSHNQSIKLVTSGLQSGDSEFFYYVPTAEESGAVFTRATGDTIRYRETSAPPAMTADAANEVKKNLDSLSAVLPEYNRLAVKIRHFNNTIDYLVAGAGFLVGTTLLVKYKGGLNQAVGVTSAGAGVFFWLQGLHRGEVQEERVKAIKALETQFPPGF